MKDCKHKELSFVSINFTDFVDIETEFEAICKCKACGRTFKVKGFNIIEPKTEGSVAVEFEIVE